MANKQTETLIVGAGPAGLSCATLLARAGREVLVLEKNREIGPKPCAGGIPASSLPRGLPLGLIERSFHSQRVSSDWQQIEISSPEPMIHTISRARLGIWMREEAEKAGARILTQARAERLADKKLYTSRGCFGFSYLVAADGGRSTIRRQLGIKTRYFGIGINYQIEGEFDTMEWHISHRLFNNGYAWIFPYKGGASVGAFANHRAIGAALLHKRLIGWMEGKGIGKKTSKEQAEAALVNFDYRGSRFANIFLVGEAAGLSSGLTGEGIAAAIHSGRQAALAILGETTQNDTRLILRQKKNRQASELSASHPRLGALLVEATLLSVRWRLLEHKDLEFVKP